MKKIRALLLLFLTMVAFLPLTHAQINKANKLYRLGRYAEAIPYYTKEVEKENDSRQKAAAITRLADCYRFTNNAGKASEWYLNAVQLENADPLNYLYYGLTLQSTGNYLNAKSAFLKYSQLIPGDPRGNIYADACDLPEKWEGISPGFEIQNMASLNSEWSDFGPSYYKDGIIITSERRENYLENSAYGKANNSYLDMYFAKLENSDYPFGGVKEVHPFVKKFNRPYNDGPAAFSARDGIIYITHSYNDRTAEKNHIKNHLLKIFYARANGKNWSGEKPFFLNNKNYSVAHPGLTADGRTIFFSSDMPGGFGSFDIWFCKWENGKWSNPENAGNEVNTFGNEVFPFILNDSTLYFASGGLPGYGGLDIFESKKKSGRWQTPVNLKEPVNSSYDDFSFILDSGGNQGFFSSNRPEGLGSDDLYACKRLPVKHDARPVLVARPKAFYISGYVKDMNSLAPVSGATIYLLNTKTDKVKMLRTNTDGFYKSAVDTSAVYLVKATKINNLPDCFSFKPAVNTAAWMKAPRDMLLNKFEVSKVFKLENFYFDLDKWNIRPDVAPELDKLAKIMLENPVSVEIGSHTDCHGSIEDNDVLSQKRAESAVKYLIQKGISKDRLAAKGYGERKLTNRCSDGVECTPAEHQANRRTEFKITAVSPVFLQNNIKTTSYKEGTEIDNAALAPDFFDDCSFE